jgi:hypothetical protein
MLALQFSPRPRLFRCDSTCYDDPTSSQLFLDPGFMHNAVLQPLQPARRYYYKFGSSAGGWSQVFSFIAPRAPGDTTSFTFLCARKLFASALYVSSLMQVHCRCRHRESTQRRTGRRLPQRQTGQWRRPRVRSDDQRFLDCT